MYYRETRPHEALGRFVQCFWVWRTNSSHQWAEQERILPDGCTELLFDFSNLARQASSSIQVRSNNSVELAGQLSAAIEFHPVGAKDVLGIKFHAHGLFPFLGHPLVELTDRVVALHEVWGNLSRGLWPKLLEVSGDRRRIGLVENALLDLLCKRDLRPDSRVQNAVQCIAAHDGLISIAQLEDEVGLGRRQLERKFALHVGISPKLYARVIRLQKLLGLVQRTGKYDWPSIALDCQFYDQSHLIRDFKALSGQTPAEFFRSDHALAHTFMSGENKTHFYNTT